VGFRGVQPGNGNGGIVSHLMLMKRRLQADSARCCWLNWHKDRVLIFVRLAIESLHWAIQSVLFLQRLVNCKDP
jgi:hypothetical protein